MARTSSKAHQNQGQLKGDSGGPQHCSAVQGGWTKGQETHAALGCSATWLEQSSTHGRRLQQKHALASTEQHPPAAGGRPGGLACEPEDTATASWRQARTAKLMLP